MFLIASLTTHACFQAIVSLLIGVLSEATQATCISMVSLFHLGKQQQEIGNYLARLSSEEQPIITIIYHRGETSCVCALPLYTVDLILSTKN